MTLRAWLALVGGGWLLGGCLTAREWVSPPPLPREVLTDIGPMLVEIGHPNGDYTSTELTAWSNGDPGSHQSWVDVVVRYTRREGAANHTLSARFYRESIEPCKVTMDVLADDGPEPILLDNGIAGVAVGTAVCDALAELAQ